MKKLWKFYESYENVMKQLWKLWNSYEKLYHDKQNVASSAALTQNNEPPSAEPRTVPRLASNILRQTYFRMQVFVVLFCVRCHG